MTLKLHKIDQKLKDKNSLWQSERMVLTPQWLLRECCSASGLHVGCRMPSQLRSTLYIVRAAPSTTPPPAAQCIQPLCKQISRALLTLIIFQPFITKIFIHQIFFSIFFLSYNNQPPSPAALQATDVITGVTVTSQTPCIGFCNLLHSVLYLISTLFVERTLTCPDKNVVMNTNCSRRQIFLGQTTIVHQLVYWV